MWPCWLSSHLCVRTACILTKCGLLNNSCVLCVLREFLKIDSLPQAGLCQFLLPLLMRLTSFNGAILVLYLMSRNLIKLSKTKKWQ